MRTTVLTAIFVLVVTVLAVRARYYFSGHQVPAGQPPLGELNDVSVGSLKAEFNRSADAVRIILLLSPT
jgi:hypothetical protein